MRSLALAAQPGARIGAGMEEDAEESLRQFLQVNIRTLAQRKEVEAVVCKEDVREALRENKFFADDEEEQG